jgi:hypothetical protein
MQEKGSVRDQGKSFMNSRCRAVQDTELSNAGLGGRKFQVSEWSGCVSQTGETELEPRDRGRGLLLWSFSCTRFIVTRWWVSVPATCQSGGVPPFIGGGATTGVIDKLVCLVFLMLFGMFIGVSSHWHKKIISLCLTVCWQMVVVCLYKQDVESFYLGTCTKNRVSLTQVKTVAL